MSRVVLLLFIASHFGQGAAFGAERSGLLQADFPFLKACIAADFPERNVANKGIALRLSTNAFACFDTDLLRMTAGWTGRFVTTRGVTFDGSHGGHPKIDGPQAFGTPSLPGWARRGDDFKDPRPEPYGPLSHDHARWKGLYVDGDRVMLTYTVYGTPIQEIPSAVTTDGEVAFVRTFHFEQPTMDLAALLCQVEGASGTTEEKLARLTAADGTITAAALMHAPPGVRLQTDGARILLQLPKQTKAGSFSVMVWKGHNSAALEKLAALVPQEITFRKGGPPHWPDAVITQGKLATSTTKDGAYTVDQLTPPVPNPWQRRVRFGGMDFFADGTRAALSTWDGDIWIVSGIDDGLEKLEWRRFASGGFETLGLAIVKDVIYTSGRDEITRYHDLNNDGSADYYENFNNDVTSSPGFHEFQFDLQTDAAGNFYTAKAGPVRGGGSGFGGGGANGEITRFAGTVQKISPDGRTREIFATGFRAPTGIGVGPSGEVTSGDNEGTWVPACPVNWIEQGSFCGVEDTAHKSPIPEPQKPLCWLTKAWDNSGGGQVWVSSDRWGPFTGELLHASYGQSALYLVLKQKVGSQIQGGVVRFPLKFTSSAMRLRFNPKDGQLYNAGLRGWQSNASKETGFDRIRYTGKPVYMVSGLKVSPQRLDLTFTVPLDEMSATDPENYSAEQWNYKRTKNYGSPEFSVVDPTRRGHDPVEISSAALSSDGRTVSLKIPALQPVDQLLVKFNLKARDGTDLKQEVLQTIHAVGEREDGKTVSR